MSGRDNKSKSPQDEMEDAKEELAIFNQFLLIVRDKFIVPTPESPTSEPSMSKSTSTKKMRSQNIARIDELYKSPEYQAEKDLLTQMNNNGMMKGLGVGVGTFLTLRLGPKFLLRLVRNRVNTTVRGGTNLHNNTNKSGYQFDQQMKHEINQDYQPGFLIRSFKFGLDSVVSLVMAAYGAMYFTDRNKLIKDASAIPLVEGRSLISDELCDDFVDVYRAIPKTTWEKHVSSGSLRSEPLGAIETFVKNCMKRSVVEKELLEQEGKFGFVSGVGADDEKEIGNGKRHVSIPFPGVPEETPITIEWGDRSDDVKVGKDPDNDGNDGNDDMYGFEEFQNEGDFGNDNDSNKFDNGDNNRRWS